MDAQRKQNKGVLLLSLPFWPPLIPPLGISCLKSYLQPDCQLHALDLNTDRVSRNVYKQYFDYIKEYVPIKRQGNLYGIGIDVLKNHIMARINCVDEKRYKDIVNLIFENTYFTSLNNTQIKKLTFVLDQFLDNIVKRVETLLATYQPEFYS